MDMLGLITSAPAKRNSPIVLNLTHKHDTDSIIKACRLIDSLNGDNILTFTLKQQLLCCAGTDLPQHVNWDGRNGKEQNPQLKIIPTANINLDASDHHMIVMGVAIAPFTPPGPMLYHGDKNIFLVDKTGITKGIPVTLYVDTAQGSATVFNYGLVDDITKTTVLTNLFPQLPEDIIPLRCYQEKLITIDELPIDWESAEVPDQHPKADDKAG